MTEWYVIRAGIEGLNLLLSVCLGLTVYAALRYMTYHLRAPRIDYLLYLVASIMSLLMFIALEVVVWGE